MSYYLRIIYIFSMIFVAGALYADNYKGINLKYTQEFNQGGVFNNNGAFLEVEAMGRIDRWDFYGFTDVRFMDNDYGKLNYDFYKYILKYDIFNNNQLFISTEMKETYGDFDNDAFIGIGSSVNLPVFGRLFMNLYYFTGQTVAGLPDGSQPYSLQFNWYNKLMDLPHGWTLTHGGWSDLDFFTNLSDANHQGTSWQFYEGITFNYESYGIEFGYKYWKNFAGNTNLNSHSEYIYLIKRL